MRLILSIAVLVLVPFVWEVYMEIHVFSTLAYENKKEKKGNQPNHDLDKETYIARDMYMYIVTCTL